MQEPTITLDVRDDLHAGRPPLDRILAAAAGLGQRQGLRLLAPFHPVPLLRRLEREGFTHVSRQDDAGDWEMVFTRAPADAGAPGQLPAAAVQPPATDEDAFVVDARGLMPPEPMVRILEAAELLPAGVTLRARTDRVPVHLLVELNARGFVHRSLTNEDGSVLTHIIRG
jgi:uncharacterized protein (DUF2249 family)